MIGRVAALAAASAAVSTATQCAEWRVAPSAGANVVSESNPRLETDPGRKQQALAADIALQTEARTDRLTFSLVTSAARRQYNDDESLNRSDFRLDIASQYAQSERLTWAAAVNATRDTTLTSELGTSGETQARFRHESATARVSPRWQLTERWSSTLTMQVQKDQYPYADSGLVDYTYATASLLNTWQVSPQDSLAVLLRRGHLHVAGTSGNVEDTSAVLQYTRTLAERWSLTASAGPAWTRGAATTRHGQNYSFDLMRTTQHGAASLVLDRSIAPTGQGYLTRRDSIFVQLHRDIAEHISGVAEVRYLRSRNIAGAAALIANDVRYRRAEASLNWAFAPEWSALLRVGHADQKQAVGNRQSSLDLNLGIRWARKHHVF